MGHGQPLCVGYYATVHGASAELQFAMLARMEAKAARAKWGLEGYHTPSHVGFPPNECADGLDSWVV